MTLQVWLFRYGSSGMALQVWLFRGASSGMALQGRRFKRLYAERRDSQARRRSEGRASQ
eukprot:CAMPEP_0181321672 /NCGR_PEP_ID=MMETSP1101-20121128/18819_1 /TAXON_ID=46948 /ORGANISM="Rhodomonas abbreviata, Strain Caron Lab Isolate" /LENGTH=58 /DNA_ID=CAMNT_0023429533 /DNA_START=127 /DNA_END=303 /DNA_ORIENTATION=+